MKVSNFEISDMPGTNTLAFQIQEDNDTAFLQKLEYTPKIVGGKNRKEFNVIEDNYSSDIVLLTLAASKAILSVGEIKDGTLIPKDTETSLSYGSMYNTEGVSYKEFTYTTNMKRRFVIVDTSTGEEVKPIVYMDGDTNEIKGKCKLLPLRPYVVIETKIPKQRKDTVSERAIVEVFNGKRLDTISHGKIDFERKINKELNSLEADELIV